MYILPPVGIHGGLELIDKGDFDLDLALDDLIIDRLAKPADLHLCSCPLK